MKRMIHSLLAAAVLVSAMTCTAFAATTDYSVDSTSPEADKTMAAPYVGEIVPSADGKSFTVSYDGAKSGEQYVLLIVKLKANGEYDNPAEPGNVTYINQDEAKDGKITFSNFIPMTSANAAVLLGGVFDGDVASPVVLGELKVPYMVGDITGDFKVNPRDSLALLRHVAEIEFITDDIKLKAADITGDGKVNPRDSLRMLRYIAEIDNLDGTPMVPVV